MAPILLLLIGFLISGLQITGIYIVSLPVYYSKIFRKSKIREKKKKIQHNICIESIILKPPGSATHLKVLDMNDIYPTSTVTLATEMEQEI